MGAEDAKKDEGSLVTKLTSKRSKRRVKTEEPGKNTKYLDEQDVNPSSRRCTDCLCCLGFLAALVGMVVMQRQNAKQAHPFKILHPLDHSGNACGLGDRKDYPKVYYPAKQMIFGGPLAADVYYSNPKNLWSMCTKECPDTFSRRDREGMCAESNKTCTWYSETKPKLYLSQYCIMGSSLVSHTPDRTGTACQSAQRAVEDVQDEAFQSLDNMGNSTQHYLRYINQTIPEVQSDPEMKEILLKIQSDTNKRVDTFKNAIRNTGSNTTERNIVQVCTDAVGHQKSYLADWAADVVISWPVLMTCMGICLVVAGLYLLVICFFVKIIIWGSIFLCTVGFAVAGWLFWDESIQVADTGLASAPASEEKILAVLCWLCSLLCIVIVVACHRSLTLGCAISGATSGFLLKNMGIMLLPQFLAMIQIAFLMYWLAALSGILSTAEILPANDLTEEYNRYVIDGTMKAKLAYHFFVGWWVYGFLEGLTTVTTSVTVTEWYYKPKVNGNKPSSHFSFCKCLAKTLVFHSGSVAFGAATIALVYTLQAIITIYSRLVKNLAGEAVGRILLKCCRCCLFAVESILKFISYNSFLMVGVTGKSFFFSAKEAWGIVRRNPKRFVVFHGVMCTINAVGRLVIIGFGLLWGALLMNKTIFPNLARDVHSPWPVLLMIFFVAYMLAGIIFGVFTTAGASLFYNFVCDEEICTFNGKDYKGHAPGDLGSILAEEAKRRKNNEKSEDNDVEAPAEKPRKSEKEDAVQQDQGEDYES
jgi:hypothetical protein